MVYIVMAYVVHGLCSYGQYSHGSFAGFAIAGIWLDDGDRELSALMHNAWGDLARIPAIRPPGAINKSLVLDDEWERFGLEGSVVRFHSPDGRCEASCAHARCKCTHRMMSMEPSDELYERHNCALFGEIDETVQRTRGSPRERPVPLDMDHMTKKKRQHHT